MLNGDTVALFLVPVALGVLIGYASGGSLTGLAGVRLRALWLLWLAATVQIGELYARGLDRGGRLPLLVITFALAGVWLAANLPGRPLTMKIAVWTALAGGLSNGVVIAVNGRMLYLPAAARAVGITAGLATPKNVAATSASHLVVLGDVIPVSLLHKVISIGDVLIILATVGLIASGMRTTPQGFQPQPQPEDAT